MYNSCQRSIGKSANTSSSCKAVLENGALAKLEIPADDQPPSPFADGKVKLRTDLDPASVQSKASGLSACPPAPGLE
ncbi:MAG: hypothetical protein HC902_12755 [Calothrix sp. SM1_5_4]|nr:hypothetical protein [Calothrix sp. SM1_5_4]